MNAAIDGSFRVADTTSSKGTQRSSKERFCQHRGISLPQTAHSSGKVAKQPMESSTSTTGVQEAEKGLEVAVVAVVDVDHKQGYALSVQQTPPAQAERTRIDWYLEQLAATKTYFPKSARHIVSDGFYSKIKWVDGVTNLGLDAIGKLRCDADMRYVYRGEQKPRGRKRKYDGKVDLTDVSRMTLVSEIEPTLYLYTVEVWVVSMKRKVRLAYIRDCRNPERVGLALLFSTDINLDASEILCFYKSRFQIEFIFRDAKQFTGLADCQARNLTKLDFHFNASLMALNLAKFDAWQTHLAAIQGLRRDIEMDGLVRLAVGLRGRGRSGCSSRLVCWRLNPSLCR